MFSRSKLALSAFALLAAGGVMAAAGPEDMNKRGGHDDSSFNLRVNIGDHGWYRGAHRPPVYRVEQPPVIAELAPRALELQAFQAGDTVIILARGENTTAGFTTSLEREWDRHIDGAARVTLRNFGPIYNSPRAQVCTPFSVSGGFETHERLAEIKVIVAGQERCLPVMQISQMPACR